jgi:hypothetical protein
MKRKIKRIGVEKGKRERQGQNMEEGMSGLDTVSLCNPGGYIILGIPLVTLIQASAWKAAT